MKRCLEKMPRPKQLFAEHVFERLYYRVYGKFNGSRGYFRFLQNAQWNSLEENQKIQAEMLYELLDYVSKEIPYYQKMFRNKKIKLTKENVFRTIKKIPVMTKETLKKEFNNLHHKTPSLDWYVSTSGGSTGKPVTLIQDNIYKMKMLLVKKWQKEWAGIRTGAPLIKLWGSEKEVMHEKEHFKNRLANWVRSVYLLDAFLMDEKKMKEYVDIINKKKPEFILAYSTAIYELAKFIEFQKLKVHSPRAVMSSAGILYPQFKKTIEKVFKCPVFNRYGSREVGDVACDCEKHEGLHISMFNHYVEILNKNLQPCKEGEAGDIYITLLTNFTMPLIRYKICDVGVYTEKKCSCGRGLPMIKGIVGRDLDNFITKDGKIIHGGIFVHFIGVVFNNGGIEKFQVIQRSYSRIEIKVVLKDKKKFNEIKGDIEEFIKKTVCMDCIIKWTFVKDIKPTKSGKYGYTMRDFR